jgi:hypothetical protein
VLGFQQIALVTFVICEVTDISLMLMIMAIKLTCPVCTTDSLQPILSDVHFSARVGTFIHELSDFFAYSCSEGHVFLVMSDHADVIERSEDSVSSCRLLDRN